jgi:phosphoglycolate phosphatase
LKAVIFDLDGTLVDSAAAICANGNKLLGELGLPLLSVPEAKRYIGNGARVFLEQALKARDGAYDPATFEVRFQRLHEIYAAAPGEDNTPYPGVESVLGALHARAQVALGMCTNKPAAPTKMVVDAHGWNKIFGAVVGGDELPERKPHPMPLLTVIERLGASEAVYIGDSEVDAATAKAAGIPFVLFTEGYRKGPIDAMPHRATFSHYRELLAIIDDI